MTSYSYALLRTKQFNNLILNNRVLRDKFVLDEYNFLQIYQALIFNDFKFLYETKSPDSYLLPRGGFNFKAVIKKITSVLLSIAGYTFLILSRRGVLVYASDKISNSKFRCDFRMANLYRQLSLKKIRFIETLHTAYDESFYKYAAERRRPALYLESIDFLYRIFNRYNFENDEKFIKTLNFSSFGEEVEFAKVLLKKYLAMVAKTRFRINCISKLLKLSGVKILICVPDTRNYHELVAACRRSKIKTYAFGSGALSKYDVGLIDCSGFKGKIIKPDTLFLSSQYWIDELLRLGSIFTKNELAIGGDIKEDRMFNNRGSQYSERSRGGVSILASYETQAPKKEVLEYIKKFLSCSDVRVVFSIRPGRDVKTQLAQYGLEGIPGNFSTTTDFNRILGDIDFAVGTQSTFLYDMVGYLKPAVVLKTDMDMLGGMIINKLADILDINDDNFCERLKSIKETDIKILLQRKMRLYDGAVSLRKTLDEILD